MRLDLQLDGLAYVLGARYTRYADDIVLSGGRHLGRVMSRIEAWVGRIALEEGFALNHRKTRCLTAEQRQSVCNIVVNHHPNLPRDGSIDSRPSCTSACYRGRPLKTARAGRTGASTCAVGSPGRCS